LQCDEGSAANSVKGARHPRYEVLSVESITELERKKSNMALIGLQSSSKSNSSQELQTPQDADDGEDSGKTQHFTFGFVYRVIPDELSFH